MRVRSTLRRYSPLPAVCLVTVLALAPFNTSRAQQVKAYGAIDWIFLIDTSESMIGKGGTPNIFPELKKTVKQFIQTTSIGDSVAIYTFDSTVNTSPTGKGGMYIGAHTDKEELHKKVEALEAKGSHTHTGEAMREALERQKVLQAAQDPSRSTVIILLTDGVEDIRDRPSALKLDELQIPPKELRPYAIFVWLGREKRDFEASPLSRVKEKFGEKGVTLFYPGAKDIEKFAIEVRGKLPPTLTVTPTLLDFEEVERGGTTAAQKLKISTTRAINIRFVLSGIPDNAVTLARQQRAELREGENTVDVALRTSPEARAGNYQGKLQVVIDEATLNMARPDEKGSVTWDVVDVSAGVIYISPLQKALKWLGYTFAGLVGILLLALIYLCIREQELPPELYRSWRTRNHLVGTIEVNEPTALGKSIRLSELKKDRVKLSALDGLGDYLGGTDAELVLIRSNNRKTVRLCNPQGPVKVDGNALPSPASTVDLFNEDKIEAGGVRLKYLGRHRPSGTL